MYARAGRKHKYRGLEERRRRPRPGRSSDCNLALRVAGAVSILVIAFVLPIVNADHPAPRSMTLAAAEIPDHGVPGGAAGDAQRAARHRDLYLNSGVQAVMAEMTSGYY